MIQQKLCSQHLILGIKNPAKYSKELVFKDQYGPNVLKIFFYKDPEIYRAVLVNVKNPYVPKYYSLQSSYWEGMLQDLIRECGRSRFVQKFGHAYYLHLKKVLSRLLKDKGF
jgi:hypothetical protein